MSIVDEINPPRDTNGMVRLSYDPAIYLWVSNLTRWYLNKDDELVRDLEGEAEWERMARYVNKSYKDVFINAVNHSRNK